jgi:hypothetical protein
LYEQIRPLAISKANIESGWRKSGLYPVDVEQPCKTRWVKDIPAARGQTAPIQRPEPTPTPLVDAVFDERTARARIRGLERDVESRDARILSLESQLNITNGLIASMTTQKKRKIVKPKVDSNEKLISYQAIVGTQEAADLEIQEENARKERRAKKAKRASINAQNALDQVI